MISAEKRATIGYLHNLLLLARVSGLPCRPSARAWAGAQFAVLQSRKSVKVLFATVRT
jgi:hypothetical protein